MENQKEHGIKLREKMYQFIIDYISKNGYSPTIRELGNAVGLKSSSSVYPFFIQQMCQVVYKNTDDKTIQDTHVKNNINEFFELLDVGFFKARYERCAESDKKFIFAMVKCGELPCTISNVAKNLHKSVNAISTTRAQLISKGIIYPVRYKELDFTVPEFTGYIQRLDEYKQWCEEN